MSVTSIVYVAPIDPDAQAIVSLYADEFGLQEEPITDKALRGKLIRHGSDANVFFIILTEAMYNSVTAKGKLSDEIENKIFIYRGDALELNEWFSKQYGVDLYKQSESLTSQMDAFFEDDLFLSEKPSADVVEKPAEEVEISEVPSQTEETLTISATEEVSSLEKTISGLQAQLAQKELLIKNLTDQLNDRDTESTEASLVETIRTLRETISEKESRILDLEAQAVTDGNSGADIDEMRQLQHDLTRVKTDYSNLQFEYEKLQSSHEMDLSKLQSLQSDIVQKDTDFETLQRSVKKLKSELLSSNDKVKTLTAENSEIGVLKARIVEFENAEVTHQAVKQSLEDAELRLKNMSVDLDTKSNALETETNKVNALTSKVEDLTTNIDTLNSQLTQKDNDLVSLEADYKSKLEKADSDLRGIKTERDKLTTELDEKSTEIKTLKTQLSLSEEQGTTEKKRVEGLSSTVTELTTQVKDLTTKLQEANKRNQEYMGKATDFASLEEDAKNIRNEYDSLRSKYDSLNKDFVTAKAESANKDTEITSKDSIITSMTEEMNSVKSENQKLQNELTSLNSSKSEGITELADLKSKLNDANVKVARLETELSAKEVELAQPKVDDAYVQQLKSELAKLQTELVGLRRKAKKSSPLDGFEGMLNLQSVNKFVMPKFKKARDNFRVVASGSTESSVETVHSVYKTVQADPNTKFVILDISSDSTMDIDFKLSKIRSFGDWLSGRPVRLEDSICKSGSLPNAYVLTASVKYTNDLGYLFLDWDKRLDELENYFGKDAVFILHIGSINNYVYKTFLNNAVSLMRCTIVTKANPSATRTTILMLTGLSNADSQNLTIALVRYSQSIKNPFLPMLQKRYKLVVSRDGSLSM